MGCGTSRANLAKSVIAESEGQEPLPKGNKKGNKVKPQLDDKKSSEDNRQKIHSSEFLNSGSIQQVNPSPVASNGNPLTRSRSIDPNSQTMTSLPPLKPPRMHQKVGFADQGQSMEENHNIRNEPIAFEVPGSLDGEEKTSSIIKRHPPRRLRRMEEVPADLPPLTAETLEGKLAEANQRRTQVLSQRVQSARLKSARVPSQKPPFDPTQFNSDEVDEMGELRETENQRKEDEKIVDLSEI